MVSSDGNGGVTKQTGHTEKGYLKSMSVPHVAQDFMIRILSRFNVPTYDSTATCLTLQINLSSTAPSNRAPNELPLHLGRPVLLPPRGEPPTIFDEIAYILDGKHFRTDPALRLLVFGLSFHEGALQIALCV